MTDTNAPAPTITATSSPLAIYTICTSYSQLCAYRKLRSVANLLQCITAYNNRHGIHNSAKAFELHRRRTLDGTIHTRRHLFIRNAPPAAAPPATPPAIDVVVCVICLSQPSNTRLLPCRHDAFCGECCTALFTSKTNKRQKKRGTQSHLAKEPNLVQCPICRGPVLSLESSTTPPPAAAPPLPADSVLRATVNYREMITISMHLCSLNIHNLMFSTTMWLCDSAMDLALHYCNKEQGINGPTLFISSLFLHQQVDIVPTTAIDGRQPIDCTVIVKCINVDKAHWIAAVWCRLQPKTIFILDALTPVITTTTKRLRTASYTSHVTHFVQFCEQLNGSDRNTISIDILTVAQQRDSSSCGLFVIEFCRVLCLPTADITGAYTKRLLQEVSVEETRDWLRKLSNTLGSVQASHSRSPASISNRTFFDGKSAEEADVVE